MRLTDSQLRRAIRRELINEGFLDSIKDLWKQDRDGAFNAMIEKLEDIEGKLERAKNWKKIDAVEDAYYDIRKAAITMAKKMKSSPASTLKHHIKAIDAALENAEDSADKSSKKRKKADEQEARLRAKDQEREDAAREKREKGDRAHGKAYSKEKKRNKAWDKMLAKMKPEISRGRTPSGDVRDAQ